MVNLKIESVRITEDLTLEGKTTGTLDLTEDGKIYVEQTGEVDNELSETSKNPVQNKVVTAALNGKVDIAQPANTILATGPPGQAQAMALGNALQIDGQSVSVKTVN